MIKNKMIFSFGIILLFIGMSISSSTGFNTIVQSVQPVSSGNTLYVGGSGPGNYTKIQDAINDSSNGDTVFVYNGTYYENVEVYKSINLIGENKNNTIIDANISGDGVKVLANWVNLSEFTIQNSDNSGIYIISRFNNITRNIINSNFDVGILLYNSNNNSIYHNTIFDSDWDGLLLSNSCNNTICGNKISSSQWWGLECYKSNNNYIYKNNVFKNRRGICLWNCFNNTIKNNTITSNEREGIHLDAAFYTIISGNTIISNKNFGIWINSKNNNKIYHNDFVNNTINARAGGDTWDNGYPSGGNYWSDYSGIDRYSGPKQNIPGPDGIGDIPYEISTGYSKDRYPLMTPWGGKNQPPDKPIILGHPYGKPGIKYNLRTQLIDSDEYSVFCMWDWGDDSYSAWLGPFPSGKFISASHAWSKGNYEIRVKAKDIYGAESNWSDPLELTIEDEAPTLNIIKPEKALYIRNRKILPRFIRKTLIIGKIDITVDAQDDSGIKKVEFYIDNVLRTVVENSPFTYTWRREKLSVWKHSHIIKVVAVDNAGNLVKDEIKVWKLL